MSDKLQLTDYKILKIKKDGTKIDRIWAWYVYGPEKVPLTVAEEKLKDRYFKIWTMLCKGDKPIDVVHAISSMDNISIAQAYRDISSSEKIFGSIQKSTKEADRAILYELARLTFKLALDDNNFKQMNAALANMIKIKGLDQADSKSIDPDMLDKHDYYMVLVVGDKQMKLDMSKVSSIPAASKDKLIKFLDGEITDVEAVEMMTK